jgi:hypothetical protein
MISPMPLVRLRGRALALAFGSLMAGACIRGTETRLVASDGRIAAERR